MTNSKIPNFQTSSHLNMKQITSFITQLFTLGNVCYTRGSNTNWN